MDPSPVLALVYRGDAAGARALAKSRGTPLDVFEAAALGDVARLRQVLDGAAERARARAGDGFSPLGLAAFFGHDEAAALLIAAGAPVDEPSANELRVAPLHSAAAGKHLAIARRLVAAGADVNARQRHGYTPLHSAAQHGDRPLAELLCAHGADRAARTDDGQSAAALARAAGHDELARWLSSDL